jgi:hypothetical protein
LRIAFADRYTHQDAVVLGDECLPGLLSLEAMDLIVDPLPAATFAAGGPFPGRFSLLPGASVERRQSPIPMNTLTLRPPLCSPETTSCTSNLPVVSKNRATEGNATSKAMGQLRRA